MKKFKTDEIGCYTLCCKNPSCNAAWYLKGNCANIECDDNQFETCLPTKTRFSERVHSKYFLLRFPTTVSLESLLALSTTQSYRSTKSSEVDNVTAQLHLVDRSLLINSTSITTTKSISLTKLVVHVSKENVIFLPKNSITLTAKVNGDTDGTLYSYEWKQLSVPKDNSGSFDGKASRKLTLTELQKGDYKFRIVVTNKTSYGSEDVLISVMPAKRHNKHPIARIKPKTLKIELPSNLLLDGSASSDDSKIVNYQWDSVRGPLLQNLHKSSIKDNGPTLDIADIKPGNYTFKLTVTDDDGATGSATANAIVLAGKDYPPKADPGPSKIIYLPNNSVILDGSASKDDKKIISYQWTKKSVGPSPDIQGAQTAMLHLSNLQEGDYRFALKVTDSGHQSSEKEVQLLVKPRLNVAPRARAAVEENRQVIVRLPATEATLNGSLSSDDQGIVQYQWTQTGGSPKLDIVSGNKAIAYVNDLKVGIFKFNLTVWDKDKLFDSDSMTLRVNENQNQKPKVKMPDKMKFNYLDTNLLRLDGSKSWDDHKIVRYQWTREDDSLAVGDVLEESDSKPVLLLTNLLPGQYKFRLMVFDEEDVSDSSTTQVDILPSKLELYLVELQFTYSINELTEARKKNFVNIIELLLQNSVDVNSKKAEVKLVKMDRVVFGNSVSMLLYTLLIDKDSSVTEKTPVVPAARSARASKTASSALRTSGGSSATTNNQNKSPRKIQKKKKKKTVVIEYLNALKVVSTLNALRHDSHTLPFTIDRVETYVCQNNCSFHGHCNPVTKYCECDTFWTKSLYRDRYGDGRPNCDWSIIYLMVLTLVVFVLLLALSWLLLWAKRRRCRVKKTQKSTKKTTRYMRLTDYNSHKKSSNDSNSKIPKSLSNGVKARMQAPSRDLDSDSNLSSDYEETVFLNHNSNMNSSVANSVHGSGPLKLLPEVLQHKDDGLEKGTRNKTAAS